MRSTEGEIRRTLRAYEAAWEALDASAVRRVQALSADEALRVERTMAAAQAYRLQITVIRIDLSGDGQRATVACDVVREFDPRVGRASRQSGPSTFELERRNDAWTIVRLR